MYNYLKQANDKRKKRALRVRKSVRGTAERPRLCVVKSNKHLYVQLIDDQQGITLLGIGTMSKEMKMAKSKDSAKKLGQLIAEKAKEKQLSAVVFDRGPCKYHGVIAELADSAREHGLQF